MTRPPTSASTPRPGSVPQSGSSSSARACARCPCALPVRPFDADLVLPCVVSKEARIRLDSNSYSVPPEAVGNPHELESYDALFAAPAEPEPDLE